MRDGESLEFRDVVIGSYTLSGRGGRGDGGESLSENTDPFFLVSFWSPSPGSLVNTKNSSLLTLCLHFTVREVGLCVSRPLCFGRDLRHVCRQWSSPVP